jgi:hypothetical protein
VRVASSRYSSRLNAAVRDLAVFTAASTSGRGWALDWEQVADLFVVEIEPANDDQGLVALNWSVPNEGVSGTFDADEDALVAELARRIADTASELWPSD